jgi:hypothetical protein
MLLVISHFWLLGYLYLNGTYSFLVITVLIAGCYGTCFCMLWYFFLAVAIHDFGTRFLLLQYSFLVASGLILGCYSTCFLLLPYLHGTCFCLLKYSFLVVSVHISGSYSTHF